MKKFYEEDITNFGRERLGRVVVLLLSDNGWVDKIDNLEMIAEEGRVYVRGWATPHRWEQFSEIVLTGVSENPIYDSRVERFLEKNISYGK